MSDLYEFCLPDVGEGLTEAEIVSWLVTVGQRVEVNEPLVQIETAKAAVEIPVPFAGTVVGLHAGEGQTVPVGSVIMSLSLDGSGEPDGPDDSEEPPMLVGYGSRRHRGPSPAPAPTPPRVSDPVTASAAADERPAAKPPVRRLARELGVDLATVVPTGPAGTVTREDVRAAAAPASADGPTRIPVRGVRKHMAAAMVASAFSAPHVTEFLTIDVTPTLDLIGRIRRRPEFRDVRVTPMAIVARALVLAVAAHPEANSSWDEPAQEILVHPRVNLGIAAATPRGLLVPNLKGAEAMTLRELAEGIDGLAQAARAGTTSAADLAGGTITISNVGVFGIDTGTPILNPGEAAILAVGAISRRPWVVGTGSDEQLAIRSVVQLALSFDHRILDGAAGSRVLAHVGALLSDPALAIL